ncbi:EAL domain-containing protein [Pseudomonas sp. HR96]|uniref:bifunctional diguanylate cyclase/phosphodiesterase n=1 Tax=Pseudomonas sp. HR96 TaxID=1027966 RepID=UPI002A748885|nr:EAL domain-containing protein [Pseudomonas sp. HR96]WPP01121.1 EAL domain-containing protein [Pseudomonas sp. HR96]
MDTSAGSPAVAMNHRSHTRKLILTMAILFCLGALVALGGLWNVARTLNQEALQQSRFYAVRALDNRMAATAQELIQNSFWTSGYDHLNGLVDIDWAFTERNLGPALFTESGYEGVFVADQAAVKYAMLRGQLSAQPADRLLPLPRRELLQAVQSQAPQRAPVSRYALFEGWPAIVTAAAILPDDDRPAVPSDSTSMLVFVDQLTPTKLRKLGLDYDLHGLALVDDQHLAADQPRLSLAQTGFNLTWQAPRPGLRLLHAVLPPLSLALLVLCVLMVYFFRFALRSSRTIASNFTDLAQTNSALEASEDRFRAVAEAASDWIWETDAQFHLTYLSARFVEVTGYPGDNWLGQPIDGLLECETTPLTAWMQTLHDSPNVTPLRCHYRDKAGQLRYSRIAARAVVRHGEVWGYRGTASDITDEVAAHAQIQHLSMHDALTGLCNRNRLTRYLDEALALKEHSPQLTVLLLDLDSFKPINDSLGHPAGDAVLLEVAGRLRESTRDQDLVSRIGGDEFVIVLSSMHNRPEIDRFCQRLIENLHRPILHDGHTLHVGVSIGVAQSGVQGFEAGELIRCADIALYQAKADGKNTWRYFAAQMNERIQHRRQLETELREAVKQGQFVLHFQPRYRLDGQEIVSVEALVRWQHPIEGLIGPDAFIPLAEQTDLIVPLGRWVLREACETALDWAQPLMVSVNLSPAQFARSDVVKDVRDVLVQTGFPAARLELEITENVMLNDVDGALATMVALKELGVRLNMDDFGTGYSSLGYLRTYPFDGLKIDKRFIASMGNGANDHAVVQAIINLGRAMGLTVTAEGVETQEQLDTLGLDDCHEVQGYFLSRPIDKQAFSRLLKAQPALELERRVGRL